MTNLPSEEHLPPHAPEQSDAIPLPDIGVRVGRKLKRGLLGNLVRDVIPAPEEPEKRSRIRDAK